MRIDVKEAAGRLENSEVVAIPTETVYGLAARFDDIDAIEKIFILKRRPRDNPLIVHLADASELKTLVTKIPKLWEKVQDLWPGPLTIVVPANLECVPTQVRAGLDTVALRVPSHPMTLELIRNVGPLVAPSANLSGKPSATTPQHVEADFGLDIPVLDGGPCFSGVESTVILLSDSGWSLLRKGAVPESDLVMRLGAAQPAPKSGKPLSPGQKYRHYSPTAKLVVEEFPLLTADRYDAVVGFEDTDAGILPLLSLGRRNDFKNNLQKLYDVLREVDVQNFLNVALDLDFSDDDLGATLKDRLVKASQN